jgi:hypothetical protein
MRASIAAESAAIPTVSLVCEGFVKQAMATGRGHGYDGLALAVLPGHVDAQSAAVMLDNLRSIVVDQVIAGLTGVVDSASAPATDEPTALELATTGTIDDVNEAFIRAGWSDGSPFIPPTRQRVEDFIAVTAHDPWRVLGVAPSSGRDVTIWSIAVNAVMAGCEPGHLPVLIAIAEILLDPNYGAEHSGNTTGADALVIVDGPSSVDLGFNHGQGALRDGHRANTTVGRWLRLYLRNVFGFTPDEHDKATFGNSARVVLAEDMDTLAAIGWQPLSADFGFGATDDVVTMARMNSGAIIGSVYGSTPEEILDYLADGVARISGWDLTHVYGLGAAQYRPLLVLAPLLARTFADAGWSKDDVRRALFERARIPAWRFEKLIGEWSNLTAGRRSLVELAAAGHVPPVFAASSDPDRLVPIVTEPAKFAIAVAGDPTRTNAYVFSNDGPHGDWTARAIDRSTSKDLVCGIF